MLTAFSVNGGGMLEPIPAFTGQSGYTLLRSPVYRNADTDNYSHQWDIQSHQSTVGGSQSTHHRGKNMQTPHRTAPAWQGGLEQSSL